MGGATLWLVLALAGAALSAGASRGLLGAPAAFELESTLHFNDAARVDREVGYKLRARLAVVPRWAGDQDDYLLEFQLRSPKLYLRGKHVSADFMPYESVWDSYSESTFYAHWSRGEIKAAYLDPDELPDVLNYKKSLLSLFQVQMLDGEYNETDVSGPCQVLYETISTEVFRKIKRSCPSDAGVVSSARRVARYTLGAGGLRALHAEELLALGHAALGLKARSWHTLRRAAAPPPGAHEALPAGLQEALPAGLQEALPAGLQEALPAGLQEALPAGLQEALPAGLQEALPAGLQEALRALPRALRPLPLPLQAAPGEAAADDEELSAALQQAGAALAGARAGEGGSAASAAAALQLLPALRRANQSAALQLLQRADPHEHLSGLCRLLGLAGTRAAFAAADDFLQMHAHDPLAPLAHAYLAGFALADRPDEAAVLDVLRLGDEARAPAVRARALLAAAAAARALPAAQHVRDALARGLARCRDEPCRALRLHALGNLRRADTADLLLEHAERDAPAAALAALGALGAAPGGALTFARLDRLQALALRAAGPLEVRAAALDLLVRRRAAVPSPLAYVAHALHERGEHELQRVLWQRQAALAPAHAALRALPRHLPPALRGWDARAPGGSSAVLARAPGWAAGGWRAELQALQVARAGLLRRGEVRLLARDDRGDAFDVLAVEVWTRGLSAFGGGSGDTSAEPARPEPAEEPAGRLGLSVAGARLDDIALFDGQAELLGHVWAGTASSPTPVLRALRPLQSEHAVVPLLVGVRVRARVRAALALALDAEAQVSLWWRNAHAELRLRAGLAAQAALRLRTAWLELRADADVRAEPRLRVAADLDFYSGVALCVRVSTEAHELARTVTLAGRARRLRVRRERATRVAAPGRSLALGRPNDATCRTLRAADAEADAEAQ